MAAYRPVPGLLLAASRCYALKVKRTIEVKGEILRRERENRSLTQEQLSELSNLGVRTVRRLESGEGSRESLERVVRALQIDPEQALVEESPEASRASLLKVEALEFEFSVSLVEKEFLDQMTQRVETIRRYLARETGFLMPDVRFRDNLELVDETYRFLVRERLSAVGRVVLGKLLAVKGDVHLLHGEKVLDPTYGLPACWIEPAEKARALELSCLVFTPVDVVSTHLTQTVRKNSHALLGLEDTAFYLESLKRPTLVADVVPNKLSLSTLRSVLRQLLKEELSIRDLETILETLADYATPLHHTQQLVEVVREALVESTYEYAVPKNF